MRLNQVTAPAKDLDASIAFYELLGLKLIVKSPHYARFELPRGEATFSLHLADGSIPRENAPQLYFECSDVDFEVSDATRKLFRFGLAQVDGRGHLSVAPIETSLVRLDQRWDDSFRFDGAIANARAE